MREEEISSHRQRRSSLKKFVSIIVPAFNAQKTIEKCINALINLNYDKSFYEIILVDNNSTDRTVELVERFSEVKCIKEPRQGRSYARNTGAQKAVGELLAFVDADVFVDPLWLDHLVSAFTMSHIGGGQGRIVPCNDDGQDSLNTFRIRLQEESTSGTNIILRLKYYESPMVNSAACLYRKEAFHFVGGFDVLLERHEDIDLAKRVSIAGFDLVAASQAIAYVEYHGEGWLSYFIRSFSEGYTKQSYNKKWQQYFSSFTPSVNENHGRKNKSILSSDFKNNLAMAMDEIGYSFLKFVVEFDSYYFFKSINATFKAFGRIYGIYQNDYQGHFTPRFCQKYINRMIMLKDGEVINLDPDYRYVFQDGAILYSINIRTNEFTRFENFQGVEKIFRHQVLSET